MLVSTVCGNCINPSSCYIVWRFFEINVRSFWLVAFLVVVV